MLFFLQNKAIVTINARTSEILTANDMAAELFGYSTKTLIGIKMSQLFADVHKEKQEALVEQHIEASGAVVMVNGKVVSEQNIAWYSLRTPPFDLCFMTFIGSAIKADTLWASNFVDFVFSHQSTSMFLQRKKILWNIIMQKFSSLRQMKNSLCKSDDTFFLNSESWA